MLKSDFITLLRSVVPEALQEEWDNCGIQIDLRDREIKKVLAALEISEAVIEEAAEWGADMIVTHHPLIFRPLKCVSSDRPVGSHIISLIEKGISVYSLHTSFDKIEGGNNDSLAEKLGMRDRGRMDGDDLTRTGRIEPVPLAKLAAGLGAEVRYAGDPDMIVSAVGICCGAGCDYLEKAFDAGLDVFISGDAGYHEARLAEELGIGLIDMGHFASERDFPGTFITMMRKNGCEGIEFAESEALSSPFKYIRK